MIQEYTYNDYTDKSDIVDEIADVEIMLDQLKIIHGCEFEVAERKTFKVVRLMNNIKEKLK